MEQQTKEITWTRKQLRCSNQAIIIKDHTHPNECQDTQDIHRINDNDICILEVKEHSNLHQQHLVAVEGIARRVLSIND